MRKGLAVPRPRENNAREDALVIVADQGPNLFRSFAFGAS